MARKKKTRAKKSSKPKKVDSKKIILGALVLIVLLVVIVKFAIEKDTVIAKVNGEKIYLSEFKFLYDLQPVKSPELAEQTLDYLIQVALLGKAAKEKRITVSKDELTEFESQYQDVVGQRDLEQLAKIRKLLDSDVTVEVTEEEAKTFLEENKEELKLPEMVNARHILVETKEEAEEVKNQLENGADFEQLAKEKSIEPAAQSTGGNLGWFPRGQMVAPFEYAAFSLRVGKISQPVKTDFGWHIIEVSEKQTAQYPVYEDTKDKIITYLESQKREEAFQTYLSEILENAEIEKKNAEEIIALLQ